MTAATFIIAVAVFFFLMPSHAAVSSVSGLCIVLAHFIPLSVATLTMILNIILLIVGFITCGNEFGAKTVYTSILLPAFMWMFEKLLPDFKSLTGDAALDVCCYIFVVSVGLSILFNMNASSGGIDIIAKILNKYMHINLGKAMSVSGMVVALSSAFAYDTKTVVLSVLGTYLNGIVLDRFIFNRNLKRRVCIVSPEVEKIRNFILVNLHSGASLYECIGAYHERKHLEIITIVDRSEYQQLMAYIQEVDPQAFVTVYQVSDMRYRSKMLEERQFQHISNTLCPNRCYNYMQMSSLKKIITLSILLVSICAGAFALSKENLQKATDYLDEVFEAYHIPGMAVQIVSSDSVLLSKTYGQCTSPNQLFFLGSESKSFTALAIMQLHERGLLNIDEPVIKYLPDYDYQNPLTIKNLLNQTSDFDNHAKLKDAKSKKTYGTYEYSNANYDLIGKIIEAVSGQPYG